MVPGMRKDLDVQKKALNSLCAKRQTRLILDDVLLGGWGSETRMALQTVDPIERGISIRKYRIGRTYMPYFRQPVK
jgi:hypothetical protein